MYHITALPYNYIWTRLPSRDIRSRRKDQPVVTAAALLLVISASLRRRFRLCAVAAPSLLSLLFSLPFFSPFFPCGRDGALSADKPKGLISTCWSEGKPINTGRSEHLHRKLANSNPQPPSTRTLEQLVITRDIYIVVG